MFSTLRQHHMHDVSNLKTDIKHMLRQAWIESDQGKARSANQPSPQDVFEALQDKVEKRFAASPHVHTEFLVAVHRCVRAERRFKRKQVSVRKLKEANELSHDEVQELLLDHQDLWQEFCTCCLKLSDLQWRKKTEDKPPMEEVD